MAYLGPSCPELLVDFFASARVGAIFVPLNARMPSSELSVFVEQSTPRVLVAEGDFSATAAACAPGAVIVPFTAGGGIVDGSGVVPVAADAEADPSAPVLILFTSGTTGVPKGAVLSNQALVANASDAAVAFQLSACDEILTFTPMFHIAGLNLLATPALSVGATVTIHRQFDPAAVLRDIARYGITLLISPPWMTLELARHPAWTTAALRSIRCVLTGGSTVTERAVRPWRDRGVRLVQGYGLTETGGNLTLVPLGDGAHKSLTAGRPTMHNRVLVVDPAGHPVGPGISGEIVSRGSAMMSGYWENPMATSDAIRDGWFHTGDGGFFDDDGYLHVVDRIKELIMVGVSNVSPADLEAVLDESPDIAAAAVVGRPDDDLGEVPVAFVVPKAGRRLTEAKVLSLFDGRLARYKHPRDVVFLDALPRTSVGKPDRKELRAMTLSGNAAR